MSIALCGFAALLCLTLFGVPLALATLVMGLLGFAYYRGIDAASYMAGQQISELLSNSSLVVVPVFILMGELVRRSGITDELYELGNALVGKRRGGLAMSTVIACGVFSTMSGSSVATAATMTRVAIPPMRRYGYHDSLSAGTVAAGGTLGILIPPSFPMVIYCIFAQEDIGRMWIAGLLPGVLMMLMFMLAIYIRVSLKPGLIIPTDEVQSSPNMILAMRRTSSFMVLFIVVLGGIYLGVFTPTEAASVGAFGAYLFALGRGRMRTLEAYREVFGAAAGTTASVMAIASCAIVFSQFVNISGLPYELLGIMENNGINGMQLVLAICVLCLLLGMIFESLGILVLIIPIFLPSLQAQGIDLIWFGVLVVILIELGLISPPLGVNVFTVKAARHDVELADIFRGVWPFIIAMIVTAGLIFYFPQIALFLPDAMH